MNRKSILIAFSDHTLAFGTFCTSPNYPKCKLMIILIVLSHLVG